MLVILTFVAENTRFGRYVYAIGGNKEAARRAGIRVERIRIIVFSIAGLMAGMGGIVLASRLKSVAPNAGGGDLLLFVIAANIGTAVAGLYASAVGLRSVPALAAKPWWLLLALAIAPVMLIGVLIPELFFTNIGTVDARGGPPSRLSLNFTGSIDAPAVPEPASWAMMVVGFGLVGGLARRQQREPLGGDDPRRRE